ncbi:MAG TPA: nitrate- and nitrite sensing domain-containing protein, partial [Actinocatenispora sp.]
MIPLATVLALAGLRLDTNVREASSATELRNMVRLSAAASAFTDQLAHESITASRLVLSTNDDSTAFDQQAARTDRAADAYRAQRKALGDVPSDVAETLDSVDSYLATMPSLRDTVRHRNTVGQAVAMRYDVIIGSLNTYRGSIAAHAGGSNAGNALRASALFSDAKAGLAYEEALAYAGMKGGQFGPHAREEFLSALVAQEQSMVNFLRTATPEQEDLVTNSVTGDAVDLADNLVDPLTHAEGEGLPATVKGGPDDVVRALGAVSDLMRWVEQKLDSQVAGDISTYRDQVVREVTVESLAVLLAIALTLLVMVLLARMMSRSLRRLRLAADAVARRDLPDAVAKLSAVGNVRSETLPALVEGSYDPIPITGADEVGQVASSFNGVHREALRIALQQAALRMNVSATFVSLARRSQKLVDKMIAKLDEVERDEEQPERLRDLFDLDHLATRMRRNDENLLILADADGGSARLEDAGLADVLAAAQSEIARYERINIGPLNIGGNEGEALSIVAASVNDVVRLFAELLENAAAFSPPSRRVMVSARRVGDQVVVEIEDHGIGMTQTRRDDLNAQLADDTEHSLASVRMMGFAVVSKLSARHNIRVHLGAGDEGGTIVHVVLPQALIAVAAPARRPLPAREPERELAYEGAGRGGRPRGRTATAAPAPAAAPRRQLADAPRLGPVPPPAPALAEAATAQLPVIAS